MMAAVGSFSNLLILFAFLQLVLFSEASVLKFQQRSKTSKWSNSGNQELEYNVETQGHRGIDVDCAPAVPCDCTKCTLSACFCSGTAIPGSLKVNEVPQMVTLTFHAAITPGYYPLYESLFAGKVNPNKCPDTGTYFVTHENSDYKLVHDLYAARHEVGVNGIDWKTSAYDWINATEKDWEDEMGGERQIISKFANISINSVRGMRAPYLQMGGNNQLEALSSVGLTYDSTRVSTIYTRADNLLWPYTYDYASIQDCPSSDCPNCSFPGVWEVPLLAFHCPDGRFSATADGCSNINTQTQAYELLLNKFYKHYNSSNRAPMVISIGASWIATDYKFSATNQFLNYLGTLKDVYVTSAGKVIDWIKNPTALDSLSKFKPWMCKDSPNQCEAHSDCHYDNKRRLIPNQYAVSFTYRLRSCIQKCPPCYPWVNDPAGSLC